MIVTFESESAFESKSFNANIQIRIENNISLLIRGVKFGRVMETHGLIQLMNQIMIIMNLTKIKTSPTIILILISITNGME